MSSSTTNDDVDFPTDEQLKTFSKQLLNSKAPISKLELKEAVLFWKKIVKLLDNARCPHYWTLRYSQEDKRLWNIWKTWNTTLETVVQDDIVNFDFERLRALVSEADEYETFHNRMRSSLPTHQCSKGLNGNSGTYICLTCTSGAAYPTLCYDCFIDHGHEGHQIVKSYNVSGLCSCGDLNILKRDGCCSQHGTENLLKVEDDDKSFLLAKYVVRQLSFLILLEIRACVYTHVINTEFNATCDNPELIRDIPDVKHSLKKFRPIIHFFCEILKYGSPLRDAIADILMDEAVYDDMASKEFKSSTKENEYKMQYRTDALDRIFKNFVAKSRNIEHFFHKRERELNFRFNSMLHEYMFWYVYFQFDKPLGSIISFLLPYSKAANIISRHYLELYPVAVEQLRQYCNSLSPFSTSSHLNQCATDSCSCNLHVSHQIFHNSTFAILLEEKFKVSSLLLSCVQYMLPFVMEVRESPPAEHPDGRIHYNAMALDEKEPMMYRIFYMIGKDLAMLWSHTKIATEFIQNERLIIIYVEILEKLHGAYVAERIVSGEHIDHDRFYDTARRAIMLEYALSCVPLSLLAKCFQYCSNEKLIHYFEYLLDRLKSWLRIEDINGYILFTGYCTITFNLPIHRHISTLLSYMYNKEQFDNAIQNFVNSNLFERLSMHILRAMAGHFEEKARMWVRNGREMAVGMLNHSFLAFKRFFRDVDFFLLRFIVGNCDPSSIMSIMLRYFYIYDVAYETPPIPIAESDYLVEDSKLFLQYSDVLQEHYARFEVKQRLTIAFLGYTAKSIDLDTNIEIPEVALHSVKYNSPEMKMVITSKEWFEPLLTGLMRLIAELIVNPESSGLSPEEVKKRKLLHNIQNIPQSLKSIMSNYFGFDAQPSVEEQNEICQLVNEICDVSEYFVENGTKKPYLYVVKKSLYSKMWCPIASMCTNHLAGQFNSVFQDLKFIDAEQLSEEDKKRIPNLWIPFRIIEVSNGSPYLINITRILHTDAFLTMIFSGIAAFKDGIITEQCYQLIVYLLTLSLYYLKDATQIKQNEMIKKFFRIYYLKTNQTITNTSIFLFLLKSFSNYVKDLPNPEKYFENVLKEVYIKDRLVGGPVEYIGRFLSLLCRVEIQAKVFMSFCMKIVCSPLAKKSKEERKPGKLLQKRLMEKELKRNSMLLKKFEASEESPQKKSDEPTGRLYECPICYDSNIPSTTDAPIGIGIRSGKSALVSSQVPTISVVPRLDDPTTSLQEGWSRPNRKLCLRYTPWQREHVKEAEFSMRHDICDWRTCGHIFHLSCFNKYQHTIRPRERDSFRLDPETGKTRVYCTKCRFSISDVLPVKLSVDRKYLLDNYFDENSTITSSKFMSAMAQIISNMKRQYLGSEMQAKYQNYYRISIKLLSSHFMNCNSVLNSLRHYVEIGIALQQLDLNYKTFGLRASLLEHMIPVLTTECCEADVEQITFAIRDLFLSKDPVGQSESIEVINSFKLKIDNDTVHTSENQFSGLSDDELQILELGPRYWEKKSTILSLMYNKPTMTHLFKQDSRMLLIYLFSTVLDSTLLENDKIGFCVIILARFLGSQLVRSLFLLLPCVTKQFAEEIIASSESTGIMKLVREVYMILLKKQPDPSEIEYFEANGLTKDSLIKQVSDAFMGLASFGQMFLNESSVCNIKCWPTEESVCKFFQKADISDFVPEGSFIQNWLSGLDSCIGYSRSYQIENPILSWKPYVFMELPKEYSVLARRAFGTTCGTCGTLPDFPTICLFCGQLICLGGCHVTYTRGDPQPKYSRFHSCQASFGAFLVVQSAVLVVLGDNMGSMHRAIYLNKYGEEDFQIMSDLYLSVERYKTFQVDWICNNYSKDSFVTVETLKSRLRSARQLQLQYEFLIEEAD